MSKCRRWLWAGLVGLLAILILLAFLEPTHVVRGFLAGEPFCSGRPTSYWREVLRDEGRKGTISRDTEKQFRREGRDAVAVLSTLAADPDAKVRWPAVCLLGQTGQRTERVFAAFIAALHDGDLEVKLQALSVLARWGKAAQPAVPDLIALLQDPEVQVAHYADVVLWNVDESAAVEACGWRPFTSAKWDFTAVFPSEPEESQTPGPDAARTIHDFCAAGPVTYVVAIAEHPADYVETVPEERRLDAARDGALAALGGKLVSEGPIQQHGLKGREHVIEIEGKGVFHSRLFWVGRRLYQVNVAYVPKFLNRKAADFFLDSFAVDEEDEE